MVLFLSNTGKTVWRHLMAKTGLLRAFNTNCTFFIISALQIHNTVKLCVKAAAYMQYFNFSVWLLFKCGFYLRAAYTQSWVCKTSKSGLAHVKWNWNLTLPLFHNYFKCKQIFSMRKGAGFSPTSMTLGRFFQAAASIRVRLMCNLSSEKVWLLFECGF